jgi:hypothetical protein
MSWLFSRALVEEFSVATCSDGTPFAPLSGNPTPQAYLQPDRMTAFSRPSRFGMTFAPLTGDHGAALLTWFLADSRARTSASPERAPALTALDQECGRTWRASWAKFDPVSSSWKTAQPCLLGDSDESSVTWPRSGMTAAGQCWELPTLGRLTSATDSGLWPTPTVCGNNNRRGASAKSGDGLATAVRLWPTPTSSLGTKGGRVTPRKSREGGTLIEAVSARSMWRTPSASVVEPKSTVVKLTGRKPTDPQVGLADQVGGSLNTTWVEWLMGWPLGWTDLKPLETDRCRDVRLKRGAC